jgi:hypothetical protein
VTPVNIAHFLHFSQELPLHFLLHNRAVDKSEFLLSEAMCSPGFLLVASSHASMIVKSHPNAMLWILTEDQITKIGARVGNRRPSFELYFLGVWNHDLRT